MLDIIRRNPLAFLIALALHAALVAFMVVGVDWREKPRPLAPDAKVVQATVVDEAEVRRELARLKRQERRRQEKALEAKRREERRLAELKKRREAEKRRLARLEKERKAREKAEAEARRKAAAEKKRLAALKKKEEELRKRQQAEKKRLAALEAKRKAEEKARAEAERKRKEAERKKAEAEKRREEAARRKAEEARRQREAAARAKAEAEARERELEAQFEAEQRASEAARIVRLIQEKVQRYWNPPPGTLDRGLKCTVNVRLGPSGSVLAVSIARSSGNPAFDRSVEAAVRKAEPLPMPDDPALRSRKEFRNHTFIFDPSKSLN